jgi:hypothetical protein
VIASAIFCVMFSWNDFRYAMFLTKADTKTISVALLSAYGTKDISWGTLGALAHFSTLPIVAMMILLNRYFVQGVTQGVHGGYHIRFHVIRGREAGRSVPDCSHDQIHNPGGSSRVEAAEGSAA